MSKHPPARNLCSACARLQNGTGNALTRRANHVRWSSHLQSLPNADCAWDVFGLTAVGTACGSLYHLNRATNPGFEPSLEGHHRGSSTWTFSCFFTSGFHLIWSLHGVLGQRRNQQNGTPGSRSMNRFRSFQDGMKPLSEHELHFGQSLFS